METSYGHLSYCSNIHPGESWEEHFNEIKKSVPVIKNKISAKSPFGIGLRLSNKSCEELSQPDHLEQFKIWLRENNCYVFTMNGFPYGNFHSNPVKAKVYAPDWTMTDRVNYTLKLFKILKELLPNGMEGSISTSPLSYRHWFKNKKMMIRAYELSALNILKIVGYLIKVHKETGTILSLNIKPEQDGKLENSSEFIEWYNNYYIPLGIKFLEKMTISDDKTKILKRHLRLCHDVCHSAIAYEKIEDVLTELKANDILIGKVQISSALKINLTTDRDKKIEKLNLFNEPTYLHQIVAIDEKNVLHKFKDISDGLESLKDEKFKECRVHFHVPVFSEDYDLLSSTQNSIIQTLSDKISDHWEVETYTWNILPKNFQLPIDESITRELEWVLKEMTKTNFNE